VSLAAGAGDAHRSAPAAVAADAVPAVATAATGPYIGLITRVLAFALDAAIINAVAIVTGAVMSLVFSVLTLPQELKTVAVAIGGFVYILWTIGYFVTFWSTTGQTPGDRALRIQVLPASGAAPLKPRRALLRFIALTLAAIPLFAGFLPILFDDRRRAVHDMIARTVVVDATDAAHRAR
jgi:uncharacterized RDD family membrane protein YckC